MMVPRRMVTVGPRNFMQGYVTLTVLSHVFLYVNAVVIRLA